MIKFTFAGTIILLVVTSIVADEKNEDATLSNINNVWSSENLRSTKLNSTFVKEPVELIQRYNYVGEEHWVVTVDGYNLSLYRISGNMTHPSAEGKRAVLLQHGYDSNPMDWIITGPGRSLAFILVDLGFDVWLGSFRGSVYSRRHLRLGLDEEAYWDFSLHEMGIYDLPAVINYIRSKNGMKKIYFIGHSQGSTSAYVMLSEKPEYNDTIEEIISLSPIAFFRNITSLLVKVIVKVANKLYKIAKLFRFFNTEPFDDYSTPTLSRLCKHKITVWFCKKYIFYLGGYSEDQFDEENYPLFLRYHPSGDSLKQLVHFAQFAKSGNFCQFDYGKSKNKKRYKSPEPPCYNLTNVITPVRMYYGSVDPFTQEGNINRLYILLGGPKIFPTKIEGFNHVDLLWGLDVKKKVYDLFIPLLKLKV